MRNLVFPRPSACSLINSTSFLSYKCFLCVFIFFSCSSGTVLLYVIEVKERRVFSLVGYACGIYFKCRPVESKFLVILLPQQAPKSATYKPGLALCMTFDEIDTSKYIYIYIFFCAGM